MQSWIEQAGRRQESKQTLLVNHKAYLKEAKIQKESMEYTKKALEAQEAVDEATKLALQRVKMEVRPPYNVIANNKWGESGQLDTG